jgi:hypothetical protein
LLATNQWIDKFCLKGVVTICHLFSTEAKTSTCYYFSSATRCGKNILPPGIAEVLYFKAPVFWPSGDKPIAPTCSKAFYSFESFHSRQITSTPGSTIFKEVVIFCYSDSVVFFQNRSLFGWGIEPLDCLLLYLTELSRQNRERESNP